jgi:hypothetical protein
MSFKTKLLQIYAKYDLNPTSLSRLLKYEKAEKIARLTRDEKNLPSFDIIQDLINYFNEIDPHWWFDSNELDMVMDPHQHYGFCKECIKKDGVIEHLKKECAAKQSRIEELLIKGSTISGEAVGQPEAKKKAS